MSGRVAVLVVNGFSPRTPEATADAVAYPWIGLCLRELTRRSAGADYSVHVWDNTSLPEHRRIMEGTERVRVWPTDVGSVPIPHAAALDRLVTTVGDDSEYLVLLDTDAIPVADDWLGTLVSKLEAGAAIVGVWRDEMAPELSPFVHVSCLAIRRDELLSLGLPFAVSGGEPGQALTGELVRRNRPVMAMRRTNVRDAHFLLGGIYADTVYHHGAGSRPAWFYASPDQWADERMRTTLRDAAFRDFDHLVSVLRGQADNDIWIEADRPGAPGAPASPDASVGAGAAVVTVGVDETQSDPVMLAHYATGAELGRLEARNRLEFERTKIILSEHLPPSGRLIDVGGGPGVYAAWLAERGYEVDLVDPVPLHVEEAQRRSNAGVPFRAHLGDARRLAFADASAEAVVMMGPLFHLVEPEDRHRALAEAFRVLREGGLLAASAMGRFFWFGHGVAQNTVRDPELRRRMMSFVDTGRRPDGDAPYPAFAHRPEELEEELDAAGFTDVVVLAIEGFFHLLGDLERRLADPPSALALFELLGRYEVDPAIVGLSGHLMAVGRRP
jgi:SAM-dependent methyltransferase